MKLLVFQHVECEHPGSLRQFLQRDGISWDAVELDQCLYDAGVSTALKGIFQCRFPSLALTSVRPQLIQTL